MRRVVVLVLLLGWTAFASPRSCMMMACLDGMEQEGYLLQALQKVERYRISGSHLEMLDASGAVVARFEAVAPR